MRIIGIDPGLVGAIAIVCDGSVDAYDIPLAGNEINIDELVRIVRDSRARLAVIERASAWPKQGVASVFRYGQAYGALRAVVGWCEIPSHLVTPAKWKKHFALSSDKEQSRALAIRLWPGAGLFSRKKDHGRAEAALIARFGQEVIAR